MDVKKIKDVQDSLAMLEIVKMSTKSMLEGNGQTVEQAFKDIRQQIKNAASNNFSL